MTLVPVLVSLAMVATAHGPASAQRPLDGVEAIQQIAYRNVDGQSLFMDAYLPTTPGTHPAIVAIHGGGFARGFRTALKPECVLFAQAQYACFTIDYRLAPDFEAPGGQERTGRIRLDGPGFPAQVDDVKAAIEFVRKNADTYRVDPQRMGTFGTSAGGTLSLTIGAESRGTYSTGWEVAGSASWSGAVSFSLRAESLTQDSEPENPALLTYVFGQPTADAEGSEDGDPTVPDVTEFERADPYTMAGPQSAAVFLANSADERVPEEFATQFAARLDELGVPNELQIYPGVQHSTALRPRALRPTVQFFDQYVRGFDPEEVRTTASANPTETEPVDTPPVDTPPPSNPVGGGIPILPIAIVAAGALVGVVVGVRLWVSRRQINE